MRNFSSSGFGLRACSVIGLGCVYMPQEDTDSCSTDLACQDMLQKHAVACRLPINEHLDCLGTELGLDTCYTVCYGLMDLKHQIVVPRFSTTLMQLHSESLGLSLCSWVAGVRCVAEV